MLGLVDPFPGYAQDTLIISDTPTTIEAETVSRIYAQEALGARFRRDRDPGLAVLLYKAVELAREGQSPDQITLAITEARQAWEAKVATGLRQDWEIDEDYATMIRHVGALAGTAYSPANGGLLGEAAADLSIMTTEEFMRDGEVLAASRRLGIVYGSVRQSEQWLTSFVYERYRDDPVFRAVYDQQFATTVGFKPTDSVAEVSAGFPAFAEGENVQETLRLLLTGEAQVTLTADERQSLLSSFSDIMGEFDRDNDARITALGQTVGQSGQMLEFLVEAQVSAAQQAKDAAEERLVFEGRRAGLYLITTALGFVDPELGQQASAVATAALDVDRAFKAYEAASKLSDDLSGYASLALTGNLVGAALSLVGAFGGSGSSADDLILQELARIRQDIADMRRNMNERFDVVDAKLDALYERIDAGLIDLMAHLRQETGRSLVLVHEELASIQARQSTTNDLIWTRLRLIQHYLDEELDVCVERRINTTVPLTDNDYVDCEVRLGRRLRPELLGAAQIDVDGASDPAGRSKALRDHPHEMFRASFSNYEALAGLPTYGLLVGPEQWVVAAEAYDTFIDAWPEKRELILDFAFDDAILEAERLQSAIGALQEGFLAYSEGRPSPAIEALLAYLGTPDDVLAQTLLRLEQEYYRKTGERSDLHLTEIGIPMDLREIAMIPFPAQGASELGCPEFAKYTVLEPPPSLLMLIPRPFQEAVDLGMGSIFYCVSHGYVQPREEIIVGMNPGDDREVEHYSRLLPGPYMASVRVEYAWGGLNCSTQDSQPADHSVVVWQGSITDKSLLAGGPGQLAPHPAASVWNSNWRERFLAVAEVDTPPLPDCVTKQLIPAIEAELLRLRTALSDDLFLQLDFAVEVPPTDQAIELIAATLGHWTWAAYNDRIEISDLLSALATGGIHPPSLKGSIDHAAREGLFAWQAVEVYRANLRAYEEFLRSERLRRHLFPGGDSFGIDAVLARLPQSE